MQSLWGQVSIDWGKNINTPGENDLGTGVFIDDDGSIFSLCNINDAAVIEGQLFAPDVSGNLVLFKYAPNGDIIWFKTFGSQADIQSGKVAVNSLGEIFITGRYMGDIQIDDVAINGTTDVSSFIAKCDAQGNVVWAQEFSGTGNVVLLDFEIDGNDELVIIGTYDSGDFQLYDESLATTQFFTFWCVKITSDNVVLWFERAQPATNRSSTPTDVAILSNNDIVISGRYVGALVLVEEFLPDVGGDAFIYKMDAQGNPLSIQQLPVNRINMNTNANDELIITCRYTNGFSIGDTDIPDLNEPGQTFGVIKLDTNGNVLWSKIFIGNYSEISVTDIIEWDENLFVVGHFQGQVVVGGDPIFMQADGITVTASGFATSFIYQINESGVFVHASLFGGASWDRFMDSYSRNDKFIFTGSMQSNFVQIGNVSLQQTENSTNYFILCGSYSFLSTPSLNENQLNSMRMLYTQGSLRIQSNCPNDVYEVSLYSEDGKLIYKGLEKLSQGIFNDIKIPLLMNTPCVGTIKSTSHSTSARLERIAR